MGQKELADQRLHSAGYGAAPYVRQLLQRPDGEGQRLGTVYLPPADEQNER